MNNDELYSYHAFLFPFQWFYTGEKYLDTVLEEKTDPAEFVEMLEQTQWKRNAFVPDTILKYNEYNYFYDTVRNILFDQETGRDQRFLFHFEYDIPADLWTYRFRVHIEQKDGSYLAKDYTLHIDSINLHLYNTGVGVLSFHLNNRLEGQKEKEDILNINQYGRRFYPPFFGMNTDLIGTDAQYTDASFEKGLDIVQKSELAAQVAIEDDGYIEDFSRYTDYSHFKKNPFQMPAHFKHLFQGIPITTNKPKSDEPGTNIFISPLLDDRMFVVCWYGNDEISEAIKPNKDFNGKISGYPYKTHNWWYKYLFIDGNLTTCQNDEMLKGLIEQHTNARWVNYGTLYGVSRYSLVSLTGSLEHLKKPYINAAFLVNHVQTMYYKISELCLVQRSSVLRFQNEVAALSSMDEKNTRNLSERISSLHKQYLQFVNKIYFREVTAQEQGIELYDLLKDKMKIPEAVKDLGEEIEVLHNYANMREEAEQTARIENLTKIATWLLPPTLFAAYLGMEFSDGWAYSGLSLTPYWPFWVLVLGSGIFAVSIYFLFKWLLNQKQ